MDDNTRGRADQLAQRDKQEIVGQPLPSRPTAAGRRAIKIAAGAVIALVALGGIMVLADQRNWVPFLDASQPVTEDRLKAQLAEAGWSNVEITANGSYLHALGRRNGEVIWMTVDSKTGKRMFDDDVSY